MISPFKIGIVLINPTAFRLRARKLNMPMAAILPNKVETVAAMKAMAIVLIQAFISELFRQSSDLSIADPIKLVCDLYKVFQKATGSKETLDDFYFWGEMLIADFDDADKNMADTHALFSNLKDLNEITFRRE